MGQLSEGGGRLWEGRKAGQDKVGKGVSWLFLTHSCHYGEEGVSARLSLPSYPVCAQSGPCRYSVNTDESVWTKYIALGPCSSCYIESTDLRGLALLAQVSSVETALRG